MPFSEEITIVAAVNDRKIFESNLLASPCWTVSDGRRIIVQEGFRSATKAYNDAIDCSETDIIVFMHQDMVLPKDWLANFQRAIRLMEETDPQWGVLGCYGMPVDGWGRGHVYSNGRGMLGSPFTVPEPVQTLDEIVLVLRKSSNLRFDEQLPHFHFYGTDICMEAAKRGRKSYVIPAFCVHNTQMNLFLPEEFYGCYRYIKETWRQYLPIQTTCVRVTSSDYPMYQRRIREAVRRYFSRKVVAAERARSGKEILAEVERTFQQEGRSNSDSCPELRAGAQV
jgi:hypothetical protein